MLDPLHVDQVSPRAVAVPGAGAMLAWRFVVPSSRRRVVLFAVTVAIGAEALVPLLRLDQAVVDVMMGFLALIAGLSSLWSG